MIKLGMIGGGINSAVGAAHVAAMRMTGKFNLKCGHFSTNTEVNRQSAENYGVGYLLLNSINDVMKQRPDRVVILSPTPDHFDHIKVCMNSGLPILCEKALGKNSRQTWELKSSPYPLSCVYNYAFYPAVQKMRELINHPEFGRVTHIHAEMPQSGYLVSKPQAWRMSDDGIYLDLGTHLHHLVWFLTGASPVSVHAIERRLSSLGVVDYASAQVRYPDFDAHMWFGKVSAGYTNGLRIRVFGTNGSVEWYQREPDVLRVATADTNFVAGVLEVQNPRFKLGHPTGFVEALANLYDAWADNPEHPDLRPSVAHEGLVLIGGMRDSANGETEVKL